MKRSEEDIKTDLLQSTQHVVNGECCAELHRSLMTHYEYNFYIIDWIPEQAEDIFVILLANDCIVEVELSRIDQSINPIRYDKYNLITYLKSNQYLPKHIRRKIEIAQRLLKDGS